MHYITGNSRHQIEIYNTLESAIGEESYVRLIDLLCEEFVMQHLYLFEGKGRQNKGRKAYCPQLLLKIYVYGYLNSIASSRRLEQECKRNIEMMWLCSKLIPDHKTISDFRRVNGEAIKQLVSSFTRMLQQSGYIKGETISIDGTKLNANAAQLLGSQELEDRLKETKLKIDQYLQKVESNDIADDDLDETRRSKEELEQQVQQLQEQLQKLYAAKKQMQEHGLGKVSLTDPESRNMRFKNEGIDLGYNLQAATDAAHGFIVTTVVTNAQNDLGQLGPMVEAASSQLQKYPKQAIADSGYYLPDQIEQLETIQQVECFVAIAENGRSKADKEHGNIFTYNAAKDEIICSEGQRLVPIGKPHKVRQGHIAQRYMGESCHTCGKRPLCTTAKRGKRSVYRFDNQQWKESYHQKMQTPQAKQKLKQRKTLAEAPFGIMKMWMGHIPLLLRGIDKVQTEINLYTLAYNFKRWFKLITHQPAFA
jgi:transposase